MFNHNKWLFNKQQKRRQNICRIAKTKKGLKINIGKLIYLQFILTYGIIEYRELLHQNFRLPNERL